MDWSLFWTALTGALGGATIGAGATLLVTWLNHKQEHKKWLRDQRHKTYVDALVVFQRLTNRGYFTEGPKAPSAEYLEDMLSSLVRVELLAPKHIQKQVSDTRGLAVPPENTEGHKRYVKAIRRLAEAMSADLGIK